eukprot:5285025-Amphidinium_carterae.1
MGFIFGASKPPRSEVMHGLRSEQEPLKLSCNPFGDMFGACNTAHFFACGIPVTMHQFGTSETIVEIDCL